LYISQVDPLVLPPILLTPEEKSSVLALFEVAKFNFANAMRVAARNGDTLGIARMNELLLTCECIDHRQSVVNLSTRLKLAVPALPDLVLAVVVAYLPLQAHTHPAISLTNMQFRHEPRSAQAASPAPGSLLLDLSLFDDCSFLWVCRPVHDLQEERVAGFWTQQGSVLSLIIQRRHFVRDRKTAKHSAQEALVEPATQHLWQEFEKVVFCEFQLGVDSYSGLPTLRAGPRFADLNREDVLSPRRSTRTKTHADPGCNEAVHERAMHEDTLQSSSAMSPSGNAARGVHHLPANSGQMVHPFGPKGGHLASLSSRPSKSVLV
jgi:hypothetical protein